MLSHRTQRIGMSPTLRISALATEYRAKGVDVLDFAAGQPDFPTPDEVKEAGKRAIDENKTRYTPNQGIMELREAVAASLKHDVGLDYEPSQVLVSSGAKASLFFAVQSLFNPGDEVIIPSPYWVSYPEQIGMAEAKSVYVECSQENGFKLDPADLERAIGPKTRGILLNYPSNPTGACYRREELQPLAEICVKHGLWVVADEIYSKLVFDGRKFSSIAELGPEIRERTIVIDGVSKTYAMTGWRIGYAAGPQEIISGMARMQSHATSNATSISQWASVEALKQSSADIDRRTREFQTRRDLIVKRLNGMGGFSCPVPEGSFYAFPNVSGCFSSSGKRPIQSGGDLAEYLLEEAKIAAVPGEAFGSAKHVRFSYALSLDRIEEGMQRMEQALAAL